MIHARLEVDLGQVRRFWLCVATPQGVVLGFQGLVTGVMGVDAVQLALQVVVADAARQHFAEFGIRYLQGIPGGMGFFRIDQPVCQI